MVTQEDTPSDFKEWLTAIQAIMPTRIKEDLSKTRLATLVAGMLNGISEETAAEKLIEGMQDSLLEELMEAPVGDLVYGLARSLEDTLISSLAKRMTDWLEEGVREQTKKGRISLHPTRSPEKTAEWVTWQMAREADNDIFYKSGELPAASPEEVAHTIYRFAGVAATMIFTRNYKRKNLLRMN